MVGETGSFPLKLFHLHRYAKDPVRIFQVRKSITSSGVTSPFNTLAARDGTRVRNARLPLCTLSLSAAGHRLLPLIGLSEGYYPRC